MQAAIRSRQQTQAGHAQPSARARSRTGGLLQRKCACGTHTIAGGACDSCRAKRAGGVQRFGGGSPAHDFEVPAVVHETLNSSGRSLDAATRTFMESRFGHDFSRVRVHSDERAAESARAVGARAYTVGNDIVFASSQYAPQSPAGRGLLAHELAHTIQQAGVSSPSRGELELGSPDDHLEREADDVAEGVLRGGSETAPRLGRGGPAVQRQNGTVEVELAPTDPEEAEQLRRRGIELPTVGPQTWQAIGGGSNHANQTLTTQERTRITQATGAQAPGGQPLATPQGPRFVLHDTAGAVGASYIQTQQQQGRGPLADTGSAAFVPGTGAATATRGSLFDPHRPASTQYERGEDVMRKATREKNYRQVWQATRPSEQTAALNRALAGQGLTAAEISSQQSSATAELNASAGMVHTTGSWAAAEICRQVGTAGVAAVAASPAQEADLSGACGRLGPLFAAREARVRSTTNVELVQPAGTGCRTTGTLKPLPPYSDSQYQNTMLLYLKAALQLNRWPEVTTHFWIDKNIGDHCDPRCFNLSRFYRLIRVAMSHGVGSSYGIAPSYGTGPSNNVWWHAPVCGGPHP
ncbi:MAG: DUF4157 domain-containing protein [Acidobacteriota bacterium]|nr:DUF4157 domain-containing protein [Acidobacteriota bacterium]